MRCCVRCSRHCRRSTPLRGQAQAQRPRVGLVLSGGGARGLAHIGVLKVLRARARADRRHRRHVDGRDHRRAVRQRHERRPARGRAAARSTGTPCSRAACARQDLSQRRKEEDFDILAGHRDRHGSQRRAAAADRRRVEPRARAAAAPLHAAGARRGRFRQAADPVSRRRDRPGNRRAGGASTRATSPPRCARACRCPASSRRPRSTAASSATAGWSTTCRSTWRAAMGADIVIAVNIGTPLAPRETLGSLLGVTTQMINILTEQNVQRSHRLARPAARPADRAAAGHAQRRRLRPHARADRARRSAHRVDAHAARALCADRSRMAAHGCAHAWARPSPPARSPTCASKAPTSATPSASRRSSRAAPASPSTRPRPNAMRARWPRAATTCAPTIGSKTGRAASGWCSTWKRSRGGRTTSASASTSKATSPAAATSTCRSATTGIGSTRTAPSGATACRSAPTRAGSASGTSR